MYLVMVEAVGIGFWFVFLFLSCNVDKIKSFGLLTTHLVEFLLCTFFFKIFKKKFFYIHFQPLHSTNCKELLPPEGISAAASLFTLIVESELQGNP